MPTIALPSHTGRSNPFPVKLVKPDFSTPGTSFSPPTDTITISGTGMACPSVSAAAANLLSDNPNLSPAQLKGRLMELFPSGNKQGQSPDLELVGQNTAKAVVSGMSPTMQVGLVGTLL